MPATADLMDHDQGELQSCELQLQNLGKTRSFSGFIRTVRCFEDNELVGSLLREPGEGHVLVIDGGGSLRTALLGDQLASRGRIHGWAGVIVNGAVRDAEALAKIDFGVKALGTNPRKSTKQGLGELDVPVIFGSVTFTPGHWLCSDDDGIVIAPPPAQPEPRTEVKPAEATTREYDVEPGQPREEAGATPSPDGPEAAAEDSESEESSTADAAPTAAEAEAPEALEAAETGEAAEAAQAPEKATDEAH
jgi:regulator of ribonuclease activity A